MSRPFTRTRPVATFALPFGEKHAAIASTSPKRTLDFAHVAPGGPPPSQGAPSAPPIAPPGGFPPVPPLSGSGVGESVGSGSAAFGTGCQSTPPALTMLLVSRASCAPSARIVHSSPPRAKAIRSPSGDHAGRRLLVLSVSATAPVPSAFIFQMFVGPSVRLNTICEPSGDHDGSMFVMPVVSVRLRWSVPSASIAQRSALPSRGVSNTIVAPSGDHAGSVSLPASVVSRSAVPVPSAAAM